MAIVSAAILSRYFNKTEYGTYRQILYVYSTLLVIFSAGLPSVFSYYLPRFSLQQGKDIVWKVTKVLFLLGLVFSSTLYMSAGLIAYVLKNPELGRGLKIFAAIPLLLLPTLGLEGILSTYKKTYLIALYNIITRILMLLCIVLPVILFKGSYEYAIYGWIVVSVFSLLLALYIEGLPFKGIIKEKAPLGYKDIFNYSFPIATAGLWEIAIKSSDQFFVSRFFGTEVFAVYSNGFINLPFVYMVTAASSSVIMPIFSKMFRDNLGLDNVINLWKNTLIKSATIIYPLVVFFIFNAKELIILVYSNTYEESIVYFQIAMILNFFNIILFSPLLFSIDKTNLFSRIHLFFAFATWGIEYLSILLFHSPIAIAVCSVTMAIFRIIVFIIFLSNIFKISIVNFIPFRYLLTLIIHSILALACIKLFVAILMPNGNGIMVLMVSFVLFILLLIGSARIFKLNYFLVIEPVIRSFISRNT
jgi:O-antigen/teichoic acid export membrane protein